MHSIRGAVSSVLSAWISAIIFSSSFSSKSAKCLLRWEGFSFPSSSIIAFAEVSGSPSMALSSELGKLVRKPGTGIWSDISIGGVVARRRVAILLFETASNTSRMAPARVDLSRISFQSQLIGRSTIISTCSSDT